MGVSVHAACERASAYVCVGEERENACCARTSRARAARQAEGMEDGGAGARTHLEVGHELHGVPLAQDFDGRGHLLLADLLVPARQRGVFEGRSSCERERACGLRVCVCAWACISPRTRACVRTRAYTHVHAGAFVTGS